MALLAILSGALAGAGAVTTGAASIKQANVSSNFGCGKMPQPSTLFGLVATKDYDAKLQQWQTCYNTTLANQTAQTNIAQSTVEEQARFRKTLIIGGSILGAVLVTGLVIWAVKK